MKKEKLIKGAAIVVVLSIVISIATIFSSCNPEDKRSLVQIDSYLDSIYFENKPGASIMVIKQGVPIFGKAYGLANIETQTSIDTEHVFGIGSVTKQFTAIAVMQLAEKNALALDDNINKYIQGLPESYENITIRNLLNHTSGIVDLFDLPGWFAVWPYDIEPAGLVELFVGEPLLFAPGEKHRYSNAGYVLLGMVIEKVSGVSYNEYMVSNIFSPLKMNNTYINQPGVNIPDKVTGYQLTGDGFMESGGVSATHFFGGGSLITNPGDMVLWYQALKSGKIIGAEYVNEAMRPTILNNGEKVNYGFGFEMSTLSGMEIIEHGGSTIDSEAYSLWIKEMDINVIVLSNFIVYPGTGVKSFANPRTVAYQIAEILIEQ